MLIWPVWKTLVVAEVYFAYLEVFCKVSPYLLSQMKIQATTWVFELVHGLWLQLHLDNHNAVSLKTVVIHIVLKV